MKYEDVRVQDPTELENIATILNNNIGKIVRISGYKYMNNDITKDNYFKKWAVIQDLYYDSQNAMGRVDCAFFGSEIPDLENMEIGFITEIQSSNNEQLYYRNDPLDENLQNIR